MRHAAVNRSARVVRGAAITMLAAAAIIRAPDPGPEAIEAMVRDAENLAYFEAFLPARAKLATALAGARRLADPSLTALCLDRIGSVLDFEGHSAAGRERHRRALALAREIEDPRLTASVLASIGLGHWRQSEYAAALETLHEARAIQEEVDDDAGLARTLAFIGRVHFKKAEYGDARKAYHRALAILNNTGDRRWFSIVLEDLGDLALEQGLFVEAVDAFAEALAARRETGDAPGQVYMLNVVGRAYLLQGAEDDALVWFEQAAVLSWQIGDRAGRALALYHMGIAHERLASPARALRLYDAALALKEELGDRRQQAWILLHAGDAHAMRQDFASALEAYGRATRIWQEILDPRGAAAGFSGTARANFELGRYEQSAESFRRAGELAAGGQPAFLAPAIVGMARAYAAAGDAARALEHGRRAADIAHDGPDEVRWTTLRTLGWIERRLGHHEAALVRYRESLAIVEALRGRVVPSASVRADFLEGKQAVYGATVELLIEMGRIEEALEVAERSRTRAFLDLLSGRELVLKPPDAAALMRIASLEEELRARPVHWPSRAKPRGEIPNAGNGAGPRSLRAGRRGRSWRAS